jgi:hypothetical protein
MKADAGFKCERCGAPEGEGPGQSLTVNLLIEARGYMVLANLVVLCRHCQGHTRQLNLLNLINQRELFEPFEHTWLVPHLKRLGLGVPDLRGEGQ